MPFNPNNQLPTLQGVTFQDGTFQNANGDGIGFGDLLRGFWNDLTGRSAQQNMQRQQQEFDEYMYQQYNSPQALKEQFEDAGLNTNLLGSTSFGTAQSAAGAPAVNPIQSPLQGASQAAQALGTAASMFADPALKSSQVAVNMSLPQLNESLAIKYGTESQLNEVEYKNALNSLQWSLEDRECNAMTMRVAYFQACQMYKNSLQEFENLVKEGKLIDEQSEREHWEAGIKQQIFDFYVDNHFFPDQDYLDFIYNSYTINGDSRGFNRFMQGQRLLWDNQNQSALEHGAFGGTIKVGAVELNASFLQYCIDKGKDIGEAIDEIRGGKNESFWSKFRVGSSSDSSSSSKSDSNIDSKLQKSFNTMDDIIRSYSAANPDKEITAKVVTDILRSEGYSWAKVGAYLEYRQY